MSIADLSTTAGSNTAINGQSIAGSANANTIDSMFQATAALLAQFYDDIGGVGTVSGTGDAIVLTSGSGFTALANGLVVAFKAGAANTTAAVINVDTHGDKAIRRQGDSALSAGDIVSGGIYWLRYDTAYNAAAGAWVLLNPTVTDTMGGWTQIGSAVTPSGASVIITSIPAGYKQLAVRLSRVEFVAAETLQLKVSVNNGSSYATAITISAALGSGTIDVSGLVIIDAPDPGASYKRTIIPNTVSSAGAAYNTPALADVTGDIDAIRLDGVGSANFDGGKVELWGIK